MKSTSHRVPGANGNQIHVLEWSTEGVPLILLHGFGNEAHIWDDFAPVVAPYYRTIALDHRGHGDSDWDPEKRYDLDALVRDVDAVTRAFEIERAVVIGHSLGGRVAIVYADRYPEKMAGLVVVDIGPDIDARGSTRIRLDVESNLDPTFGSVAEYARALSLAYPAATPAAIDRMARHGLRRREDGLFQIKMDPALRGGMVERDRDNLDPSDPFSPEAQWKMLAGIKCPTLVVRGAASDILSADTADKMVDDVLANGRLEVVGRAGHSVMTDNPEGFEEALSVFLLAEE